MQELEGESPRDWLEVLDGPETNSSRMLSVYNVKLEALGSPLVEQRTITLRCATYDGGEHSKQEDR